MNRMRYAEDNIFKIEKAVKKLQFKDRVDKNTVCETVLDIIADYEWDTVNGIGGIRTVFVEPLETKVEEMEKRLGRLEDNG
tara:strand:- start:186 stop:428 length:243 start_codon:yes stop_codon:yes gene_type:complete